MQKVPTYRAFILSGMRGQYILKLSMDNATIKPILNSSIHLFCELYAS